MPSGYEHEVRACLAAIERGDTETPFYSHEDTLFVMGVMDAVRERLGLGSAGGEQREREEMQCKI
jgi:hypothetical protein